MVFSEGGLVVSTASFDVPPILRADGLDHIGWRSQHSFDAPHRNLSKKPRCGPGTDATKAATLWRDVSKSCSCYGFTPGPPIFPTSFREEGNGLGFTHAW